MKKPSPSSPRLSSSFSIPMADFAAAPETARDSEEKAQAFVQASGAVVGPKGERTAGECITEVEQPEYRVYRRRWIGLVMLMIMNIVVSWGWLTFAPVSNLTAEWFHLSSESPVNWLSTVILFAYVVATP
jgi:hypothetical protein